MRKIKYQPQMNLFTANQQGLFQTYPPPPDTPEPHAASRTRYFNLKQNRDYENVVLLIRDEGEFYYAYYGDAHTISERAGIKLQKQGMITYVKINFYNLDTIMRKVIKCGYRMGIVDELKNPQKQV